MWRQGDLLIKKLDAMPENARRIKGLVLAKGETTGHAHRLTAGEVFEATCGNYREMSDEEFFKSHSTLYVKLDAPAELVHEEHGALALEPGFYQVVRQRTYSPFRPWGAAGD